MSQIQALIEKAWRYLRSVELLIQDRDYDSSVSPSYYAMFYSDWSMSVVDDVRYCHVGRSEAKSRHLAANGGHRPGGGRFLHCGPLLADLQSK